MVETIFGIGILGAFVTAIAYGFTEFALNRKVIVVAEIVLALWVVILISCAMQLLSWVMFLVLAFLVALGAIFLNEAQYQRKLNDNRFIAREFDGSVLGVFNRINLVYHYLRNTYPTLKVKKIGWRPKRFRKFYISSKYVTIEFRQKHRPHDWTERQNSKVIVVWSDDSWESVELRIKAVMK